MGDSPMRARLLPEISPRWCETSNVPQAPTSTSLATSRPRRSRPLLNASNQTRQPESTRSTRSSSSTRARNSSYTMAQSSSYTLATKPTNGSESSSPSASTHPRSQKSGAGPRSSNFQSQTSRRTILKDSTPYRFSASLTSSWNASSMHASTW